MKKLMLLLLSSLLLAQPVFAEAESEEYEAFEGETKPTLKSPQSYFGASVSAIEWTDALQIREGVTVANDYASYNGLMFSVQKEFNYGYWGWSGGAFIGIGSAVGGGNSEVIAYSKNKVGFILYGFSPRVFYNLSGRISLGVSVLGFMRNINWPTNNSIQTVDSGRNINVTGLADINIRLFKKWDFYTGIGPLSESSTFWKIGLLYRY